MDLDPKELPEDRPPRPAASFADAAGVCLPVDHQVTVENLTGIRATATSLESGEQFFLEGVLNAEDMEDHGELLVWEEMPPVGDGRFELQLGGLAQAVRRMLSTSSDLDAHVRLRVGSNRQSLPPLSLHVTRFDLALEIDGDEVKVVSMESEPLPDLSGIRLVALPLWDPDRASQPALEPASEAGRWSLPSAQLDPGPWLILGWRGEACRVRPLPWNMPGNLDDGRLDELQRALALQPGEARSESVKTVFDRLTQDPSAPEWAPVLASVRRLEILPPAALPVTVELAKDPAAAAAAVIAAGDDIARIWALLEELPFGWWQVPVRTWVRIGRAWRGSIRAARSGDMLREFFDKAAAEGRFLESVGEWARVEVLGESRRRTQLGMGLEIPVHVLEQEREALFQRGAERWWPQGDRCVRWLKDYGSKLVGGLTPLKQVTIGVSRFKRPVLAAPVVAALSAALDLRVDQSTGYQLRRLRDFDREWFDAAHMLVLRIAITALIDDNPEILR